MTDKKITASFILEILGKPKEHIHETLGKIVDAIDKKDGVSIIEKKIHEPKELEEKDEGGNVKEVSDENKLYTSFAEIEAEFEQLQNLVGVIFEYMPSNLEIVSPEKFQMENVFLSEILTGVLLRLHKYDELTKGLINERGFIMEKLVEKFGEEKLKEIFGDKK